MNRPWGRNGDKIESIKMLKRPIPVIGTGEWPDHQCSYFKGIDNGLKIGDIILVREGADPIALCEITSDYFKNNELEKEFFHKNYRKVKILDWYKYSDKFPQPQKTLERLRNPNTESWNFINTYYNRIKQSMEISKTIELLKYKKQIILQGPPGTGKTRVALLVANELTKKQEAKENAEVISKADILNYLEKGLLVDSVTKYNQYKIENIENDRIELSGKDIAPKTISFNKIIESYSNKQWEPNRIKNGLDSYEAALAFYIYNKKNSTVKIKKSKDEYIKLIQFHPSYTYEDFVRGIVVNPNKSGDGIIYKAENKILANFAKQALDDFCRFGHEENTSKSESNIYVLIIDEINRANLSSVLGELIYALEYRTENVESMYEVEGNNKIMIPPNLYIIGTMNTADRSVGHIDYAIRRRFAFVDVLPKDLSDELGDKFDQNLFQEVSKLFDENLSPEFNKKDVQIGHSYFIDKSEEGGDMKLRLEFEIKPILLEYVREGILSGNDIKNKIDNLSSSI